MDLRSLQGADVQFAQRHVRILDALYGILKPLDSIKPYRLEMGSKLQTQRGKNLYAFWGNIFSETLNRQVIHVTKSPKVPSVFHSSCAFMLTAESWRAARQSQLLLSIVRHRQGCHPSNSCPTIFWNCMVAPGIPGGHALIWCRSTSKLFIRIQCTTPFTPCVFLGLLSMPKQQGEAYIPACCVHWHHSITAAMKTLKPCNTAADNTYGGSLQLLVSTLPCRGAMVRYIVQQKVHRPEQLQAFTGWYHQLLSIECGLMCCNALLMMWWQA